MPSATSDQSLFAYSSESEFGVDGKDWCAVRLLIHELEEEMIEKRSALLYRLSVWNMILRVFKRATREKMIIQSPSQRDYSYHRSMLNYLKGFGRMLLQDLDLHQKVDPTHIGVSYQDVAAMVQELEYQEREWYGDMTAAFREDLLKQLFPDA